MASRVTVAANLLMHHPAYLFSRFWPLYSKYESARLLALRRQRTVDPVLCMGMFFMFPDSRDSNTGVSSSILLRGGWYEPESTEVFRQLIGPGDTVIDIGANIGWYTLLAAKIAGPKGKVIACEPEPHNFGLLQASVKFNHLTNATLVQKCVSDRSGEVLLSLSSSNAGGHSIVSTWTESRRVKVHSTTLDDLASQLDLGEVTVIKMDAESAEPLIFRGGKTFFSRGKPRFIIMEFSPAAWVNETEILDMLFEQFEVHEIRRSLVARVASWKQLPKNRQAMLLLARRR